MINPYRWVVYYAIATNNTTIGTIVSIHKTENEAREELEIMRITNPELANFLDVGRDL